MLKNSCAARIEAWVKPLHLFSVDQNGGISKLYSNDLCHAESLASGRELVFPEEALRSSGLKMIVRTPKGVKKAVESVLVIATRENLELLENKKITDPAITDLMRELSEMDPSQWVERTVGYEVGE